MAWVAGVAWPGRANVAEAVTQEPQANHNAQRGAAACAKHAEFIKLIEPRARRASPQGHGKSLPDAVKTIDFPSVLEGFWPNPSNRLRPSVK